MLNFFVGNQIKEAHPFPLLTCTIQRLRPTMHVLHTESSSGWGGQEIRIIKECLIYKENGHTVSLIADPDNKIFEQAPKYNITVYACRFKLKNFLNLIQFIQLLKHIKPDVISCHSGKDHWLAAISRLFFLKKNRPSLVRTRHISLPLTRNFLTQWLYTSASDAIMTTAQQISELIANTFSFPRKKVILSVPTGINPLDFIIGCKKEARNELGISSAPYVFGIVATLRSWKGHYYLIEAFAYIHRIYPNSLLLIVGDGPQLIALKELVSKLNLDQAVIFTGHQENTAVYFRSLDCFVLPSYANEGVPQAILQAMAFGIPVITCPVGGIPEATIKYPQVFLVQPKDIESLKSALETQITLGSNIKHIPYIPFNHNKLYSDSLMVYQESISYNKN